jgi:hypothetical protein
VNGKWQMKKPSRSDYTASDEPHERGAVLVSAVFAAFETIYRARANDLIRLSTNGTGVLPLGEISQDLAGHLAREAAKVAGQVLTMCIRALDYCPPIDLDFGEYLRAIITADRDLVPEDDRGYRVAFISAFRDRGIFPKNVRHLAEDSLVWEPAPFGAESQIKFKTKLIDTLDLNWNLNAKRKDAYRTSSKNAKKVHAWLMQPEQSSLLEAMGFVHPQRFDPQTKLPELLPGVYGEMRPIEVHSVRPSRRTAPNGTSKAMLVIEIVQTFRAEPDQVRYRGGCTLLVDLNNNLPSYLIRKRLGGESGAATLQQARFRAIERAAERGARYMEPTEAPNTFALLHRSNRR